MSSSDHDAFWMRRALAEAVRGMGAVEPNPMVGAAVVRDGSLVAVGHHARFGGPHAEVVALDRAGEAARGATIYVTLEPCCHTGKTPPCTEALVRSGIARVVAATSDPFPRVAGGGLAKLRAAGIEVTVGVEAEAAIQLNLPYFKRLMTGRPYVTAKWAMTLDGRIATAKGQSQWISGPGSRARVHELRGRVDAILVGVGTALADDPRLDARPVGPRQATRVVADSQARLPRTSRLVITARELPLLVAVTDAAPPERCEALAAQGADVVTLPARDGLVDVAALLGELGRRDMTHVLVEGGAHLLGSLFDLEQVDAVDVFIAPMLETGARSPGPVAGSGKSSMMEALRLVDVTMSQVEGDLRVQGTIAHPWLARLKRSLGINPADPA